MKNQKGITLIALVVTIVVLLILAGITIVYVLQDGSIFQTAKESAVETAVTSIADYAQQMQVKATSEYYVHNRAINIKVGVEAESDTEIKMESFFPSGMTVESAEGLKAENGDLSGTFTVTSGGHKCVMKFESGVLTCSTVDDVKYTGPYAGDAE